MTAEHGSKQTDPQGRARIRQACELAKRRLTRDDEARVAVSALRWGRQTLDAQIMITRSEMEDAWMPLLERIRTPIVRALRDASCRPEQIDEVLLVGGATRMACVSRLATQIFGQLPLRSLPADEAVCMGAAVQAGLKAGDAAVEDLVVTDVAPFTLGVESASRLGSRMITGVFSPILDRGTVIPASRVERFSTLHDNQRDIDVNVFQGEHSRCSQNQFLGSFSIKRLPRRPAGLVEIDTRFTYDLNGILEVESTVVGTSKKATMVIEQRPGQLDKNAVVEAVEAMRRLKFHPRDGLPNTTALARAEALYLDLTGESRQVLGVAIQDFRLALDGQDAAMIDEIREGLIGLTETYRR